MADRKALHMTLADVAALTRVQRPVVSMWRTRSAGGPLPFPAPVSLVRGVEMFDAGQVGEWLQATERGNNPEAAADVAAFARPAAASAGIGAEPEHLPGLTALLVLKAKTGLALASASTDELLDSADEVDPDNAFLYSEIASIGETIGDLAAFTDALVDSAYNAPAAFEQLLEGRFRSGLKQLAVTSLNQVAIELVTSTATELAVSMPQPLCFVDSSAAGSDLLINIANVLNDTQDVEFRIPYAADPVSRLARRRFEVHRIPTTELLEVKDGGWGLSSSAIHISQFPSPGTPVMSAQSILEAIDAIALDMDDSQRAVIIAPASALCDPLAVNEDSAVRDGLLRAGRVRAIVRLPQGLLRTKPREHQALWVLGPSFEDVAIADKWTVVADLSTATLTRDVIQDLISDVVAAMDSAVSVRRHSFRFARLVRTSALLASHDSLVASSGKRRAAGQTAARAKPESAAALAVRVTDLIQNLSTQDSASVSVSGISTTPVSKSAAGKAKNSLTIQDLISAGTLSYRQGNRISTESLEPGTGPRVIRVTDLTGPKSREPLRLDLLTLSAAHPGVRLTDPGDVVFSTTPRPAAIVDRQGGSVVAFPARSLSINGADPGGVHAEVLAAEINALPPGDKAWRHWIIPQISDADRNPLSEALNLLRKEQDSARRRLGQLEELTTLITDGVASGKITLTTHDSPTEGPK
ncbi:hypothetical protein ACQR35_04370 [Pseudarthrobacter sp. J1738]|uniref:hypothetical protein n=1 Tax=Pseudarthrobacter sp. J1738 TaxID=3420446 RepID=UPI003D2AA95F